MDDHTSMDTLRLPGALTHIPEFHDCQRFIAQRKLLFWSWQEYQSLLAIWVRNELDSVAFPMVTGGLVSGAADSLGATVPGTVRYWLGDSLVESTLPEVKETGVAVALVWSDGRGYGPLGIHPGYNCLYLYDPAAWKARMVPVADENECHDNVDPAAVGGMELPVYENRVPGRGNDDYPPVARWDQGGRRSYYAAVKCLAAWCEIGRKPEESSSQSYAGGRTRDVKGWYDEQNLAVWTDGGRWPTHILGAAFPDEGLDALTRTKFPEGTWVPVAQVVLRADGKRAPNGDELETYHRKFNFELASTKGDTNHVEFCYGSADRCFVGTGVNPPSCTGYGVGQYWARIISAGTRDTAYRCVTYTDHGVTMPGMVRWRWLANDEKNWVSCPSGCCQVNQ